MRSYEGTLIQYDCCHREKKIRTQEYTEGVCVTAQEGGCLHPGLEALGETNPADVFISGFQPAEL